jgi:hypothetical protein
MKGISKALKVSATIILSLGVVACNSQEENKVSKPASDTVEFIPSKSFLQGIRVSPPQIASQIPKSSYGSLKAMDTSFPEPFWTLNQWLCLKSLSDSDRQNTDANNSLWQNEYGSVQVTLDEEGVPELILSLNSLNVFRDNPTYPVPYGQMFAKRPHFLISRNFFPEDETTIDFSSKERHAMSVIPNLSDFESLTFSMEIQLLESASLRNEYAGDLPENYDRVKNRTEFYPSFIIYNRKKDSGQYGKWFWICSNLYNSARFEKAGFSDTTAQPDLVGIYPADGTAFLAGHQRTFGPFENGKYTTFLKGKPVHIQIDMLNLVSSALQAINQHLSDLDQQQDFWETNLSHYTISYFNMGWESAGPFRGSAKLKQISLKGKLK